MRSRARWFVRARPVDYMLAISEFYATLPVVGKHLEPLGAVAAMGAWGYRHAPGIVSRAIRNRAPSAAEQGRLDRIMTNEVAAAALLDCVSPECLDVEWPMPERLAPVWRVAGQRRRFLYRSTVRYGPSPGQVLDVWRRKDLPRDAPVLVFVPGGAWVVGSRMFQSYPLMSHLADQGWVCLSIGYRVSPHNHWPQHVADVKAAVAWARANADQFGGDPNFVAIAGCSAGGHLAALTGLTHDDPGFHVDLPDDADTSVDAVVGIYGRYDWEDRSTPAYDDFVDFLERVVVRKRQATHPELFRNASPIARVRPDVPPFLVVHGSADNVIPVTQARAFVERLREVSQAKVGYLELPGAHHGFDFTDGARTRSAITVIGLFLDEIHRGYRESRPTAVQRQSDSSVRSSG